MFPLPPRTLAQRSWCPKEHAAEQCLGSGYACDVLEHLFLILMLAQRVSPWHQESLNTSFPELLVSLTPSYVGAAQAGSLRGSDCCTHTFLLSCSFSSHGSPPEPWAWSRTNEPQYAWQLDVLRGSSWRLLLDQRLCLMLLVFLAFALCHLGICTVEELTAGPPFPLSQNTSVATPSVSPMCCVQSVVVLQSVFRLTLFLLQEYFVLCCCLNSTWLFFSPKLVCKLLPLSKWMGSATIHSSSHLFLLHLLVRARQRSSGLWCRLCWGNGAVFAGADWHSHGSSADVSSGTVWNSQHCSWGWWLADGRRSYWIII